MVDSGDKKSTKLIYGLGNLGYSVISQTMTNFFMFFGTSVIKLSGVLVGIAIAISTFWDGFTDPIVGYLSDTHDFLKMGNRKGYMFAATFGMILFNLFIFIPVCKDKYSLTVIFGFSFLNTSSLISLLNVT